MSITYLEAIREAQAKLLRDDERVLSMGRMSAALLAALSKQQKVSLKNFPDAY